MSIGFTSEQFDPERPIIWGDESAPPDFPAYEAIGLGTESAEIVCKFRGCGHKGTGHERPEMECGPDCPCPCCKMLQGFPQFGCTYGGYDRSKPAAAADPRGESQLKCPQCGYLHCICKLPLGLMI